MKKVWCNRQPVGDIRTRQPKQPGQKKAEWNYSPETVSRPREKFWANITKNGQYRCCYCGHIGHDLV